MKYGCRKVGTPDSKEMKHNPKSDTPERNKMPTELKKERNKEST